MTDQPEVTKVLTQKTYWLRNALPIEDGHGNELLPSKIVVETRGQRRRAVVHGRSGGHANFNISGYDYHRSLPDWMAMLLYWQGVSELHNWAEREVQRDHG